MESLVLTLKNQKGEVMGYTHYFTQTRDFTDNEWIAIKAFSWNLLRNDDAKKVIDHKHDQKLEINNKTILFNGIKNDGHETFVLGKKIKPTSWKSRGGCFKKGEEFQFCKTAYKPYDKYVVAVLCYINAVAPDACKITSDGWKHEWQNGLNLAHYICDKAVRFNSLQSEFKDATVYPKNPKISIPKGIENEVSHG